MHEELTELIRQGKWMDAEECVCRMEKEGICDISFQICRATVCEQNGDYTGELRAIADGLSSDWKNYELFYMLGLMLQERNLNQAWLCVRQAEWYCAHGGENPDDRCTASGNENEPDRNNDLMEIRRMRCEMEKRPDLSVRGLSIVILSYNNAELTRECLGAVRHYHDLKDTQIVVTDNASADGIAQWLRTQDGITLIENGDNVGFPDGCNIGVLACNPENDVMLLNNDAILTPNALFWLRMGLYADRNVGAVGPVSNNAVSQTVCRMQNGIADRAISMEPEAEKAEDWHQPLLEWTRDAAAYHLPLMHPYEDRCRLTGFAVLIRRETVNHVLMEQGLLLDPRFAPAYFEDDDLGMRIAQAGYRQLLCHNSVVWHAGGKGFDRTPAEAPSGISPVMQRSREKFCEKWGFDIWAYELPEEEIIEKIETEYPDHQMPLRVLQIDCGMGTTLSAIRYLYPNAYAAGIESVAKIAGMAKYMGDILTGNPEKMELPYPAHSFDVIIASGSASVSESASAQLQEKLRKLLKPEGMFLL